MTRDDIIYMARQAGLGTSLTHGNGEPRVWIEGADWHDELERFAALVAAAVAPVCGECGKSSAEGWALYCVQCSEDSMVKAAVAEEREACALLVENCCSYCAERIRERGEEPMRHPGYIIGDHWLQAAYTRICTGETEAEVMADYGYYR